MLHELEEPDDTAFSINAKKPEDRLNFVVRILPFPGTEEAFVIRPLIRISNQDCSGESPHKGFEYQRDSKEVFGRIRGFMDSS